jgi:hypothetical protein
MGFLFDSYIQLWKLLRKGRKECRTFWRREYIGRKWRDIKTVRGREREREKGFEDKFD